MTPEKYERSYRRVKIAEATTPSNGIHMIYKDRWWCVTDDEEILFFKGGGSNSPQCNDNEEIAKQICSRLHPACDVRLIPAVYQRVNPHDYCC